MALISVLLSGYRSFDEARYLAWGRVTEGRLLRAVEIEQSDRGGRRHPMLSVDYTFQDAARNSLSGHDLAPPAWDFPAGGRLAIQYIPGDSVTSRLRGNVRWLWVNVFLGSLVASVFVIVNLALEAKISASSYQKRRRA